MRKSSFFKLPLLLTLFYMVINEVVLHRYILFNGSEYFFSINETAVLIVGGWLLHLPLYLLVLFVSSVMLQRSNIQLLNITNIILVMVIAVVIFFINSLISSICTYLLLTIGSDFLYRYHDNIMIVIFIYGFISVLRYLPILVMLALLIKWMRGLFIKSTPSTIVDLTSRSSIHCLLFLTLFISIITWFIPPLVTFFRDDLFVIICFFGVVAGTISVYFIIKSNFSYPFTTLQVARIIRSALLALLFIIIFNSMTSALLFMINHHNLYQSALLFIAFLQAMASLFIVWIVTKRYFSLSNNKVYSEKVPQ